MKLFVNELDENWICNRIRAEFVNQHNSFGDSYLVDDISECDTIWLLFGWGWMNISPSLLQNRKVILTVHHIDPEKYNLSEFLIRDNYVDLYHVPNEKVIEHFPEGISRKKIKVLPYWYDSKKWRIGSSPQPPRDVFTIGSFQRDTEGFDLATPKLSKGPDLFCDVVENLNSNFRTSRVILAGYRRQYVISRLEKAGIDYEYHELVNESKMAELYRQLDLYLVTSRHEGGPQAVLEAAATATPILSTDVGMAPEVLSNPCITDFDSNSFVDKVKKGVHLEEVKENIFNVKRFCLLSMYHEYIKMFLNAERIYDV